MTTLGTGLGSGALRELAVRLPLASVGLALKGRSAGSPSGRGCSPGDKPGLCPPGTPGSPLGRLWTRELLERTETGGGALADLGFRDFRVRYLEWPGEAPGDGRADGLGAGEAAEILEALQPDYTEVLLDLEERDARQ
ncbi:MAG: hypothetical protein ACLU9S_23875 [Oscillospiraceae bacterium]